MHGWKTERLGMQNTTRVFAYDGLGRLTRLQTVGMGGFVDIDHEYDGSNNMVLERRTTGPLLENITRFQGSRHDLVSGNLIQEVLPMARLVDGEIRWIHMDADGHALEVLDADGTPQTFEVSGVYGHRIPGLFQGSDWKIDGVHGGEADRARGIVHRGQRHHMLGDGMWLQPEPLLHLGIDRVDPGAPRAVSGVYALGNPLTHSDETGFIAPLVIAAFVAKEIAGEGAIQLATAIDPRLGTAVDAALTVGSPRKILTKGFKYGRKGLSKAKSLFSKPPVPSAPSAAMPGACFVAGTEVATPAGASAIEDVQVGDLVISASLEANQGRRLEEHHRPGDQDVVLALGAEDLRRPLSEVKSGQRFVWKGRVFDTSTVEGAVEIRWSGDVVGKVVGSFVRIAPAVIEAEIAYSDGTLDTLTGTPNHPFWVDAAQDYVALGKLEVGTVLRVQAGGDAILVSKTWRHGDVEVFDIEIEGLHNFYVRGHEADVAGVLVHNSSAQAMAGRADEMQGVLQSDPIALKQRTAAALDTDKGVILGGGKRDLNPTQRATAQSHEILSKNPKKHAEMTTLGEAAARGAKPKALGASRDFCDDCVQGIQDAGGTVTGPRTAVWDD